MESSIRTSTVQGSAAKSFSFFQLILRLGLLLRISFTSSTLPFQTASYNSSSIVNQKEKGEKEEEKKGRLEGGEEELV